MIQLILVQRRFVVAEMIIINLLSVKAPVIEIILILAALLVLSSSDGSCKARPTDRTFDNTRKDMLVVKAVSLVLRLRLQLAKSSVKKYQAMQNAVCKDGRAHGMFQFYGANRSGRWAGRLIQLQNLPQNHMPDLAEARAIVKAGDYDTLQLLYDDIPDTLSQLIRTAFVPRPGYKFIVSDFSAIEARVLAYLTGETWRSKVFAEGKDIYCASASQMFGVPVEKHGINGHLRQKGKIAELALGYGGSVGVLKSMGALEMGLTEEELQPLVNSWRNSNPMITAFWWDIDRAVKTTITQRIQTEVRGIRFFYKSGMLFIKLPSGRLLSYVKPRIGENQYGGDPSPTKVLDLQRSGNVSNPTVQSSWRISSRPSAATSSATP